jgi:antagonist of KipI
MDPLSHAIANIVVGNSRYADALEVTLAGPELRVSRPLTIAIAGADLSATLDGVPVRLETAVACHPGAVLRFGERRAGARAYLAVSGGVTRDPDDRSDALMAGQRLGIGTSTGDRRRVTGSGRLPRGGVRVRVLPGPQQRLLPADCCERLCAGRFVVSSQSNRVGYRLAGPRLPAASGEMISDATFPGAIQVPPSGEPILLMADRQTTGGYPQVAIVISADLPLVGQLAPGDWIEFAACSPEEARAALAAQEAMLADAG